MEDRARESEIHVDRTLNVWGWCAHKAYFSHLDGN